MGLGALEGMTMVWGARGCGAGAAGLAGAQPCSCGPALFLGGAAERAPDPARRAPPTRAPQTRPVTITRLIVDGSVEQQVGRGINIRAADRSLHDSMLVH